MRLSELATYLKGTVHLPAGAAAGEQDPEIDGVAPIESARPGAATFVASAEFARHAAATTAGVVITAAVLADCPRPQLLHKNPYWAFAKTAQRFVCEDHGPVGVSPLAYVAPDAVLGARVTVGPFAYVGPGAQVGDDCVLYPGVYVGPGAAVGDGSVVRANVVLEHGVRVGRRALIHGATVIGADGFGFAPGDGGLAKIPQVGSVVLGDDVEVGGNCSVDRGAMADTRIGDGSKLDSHVHVGHNTVVGRHCMLCGTSATAGSVKLGDGVVLAGRVSVAPHCEIDAGIQVGALSGVTQDLRGKGVFIGFPAQPAGAWRREVASLRRLPEGLKRLAALEAAAARVPELEARLRALEDRLAALVPPT